MSEFIPVASLTECREGELLCVKVANSRTRILLAKVEGVIYALDDLCSHEDAPLSKGCLQGTRIKCPLHGSRFDLKTGLPLEEPATTAIKTYPVRVVQDKIQVCL